MKRVLVLGLVLAGLLAGTAQALEYEIVLSAKEARETVKRTGGSVHSCKRVAPRRFRCTATYWKQWHEAEEVEPGRWVETANGWEAEEVELIVGLYGIRRVPSP